MGPTLAGPLSSHAAMLAGAFAPCRTHVASGARDKMVRVWNVCTGACGRLRAIAFALDGPRVVSKSVNRTLRVWDALSGRPAVVLAGHDGYMLCGAYSPDGAHIALGSADRQHDACARRSSLVV